MRKETEKDIIKGISESINKAMDGSRQKVEEVSAGAKDLAKEKGKDIRETYLKA